MATPTPKGVWANTERDDITFAAELSSILMLSNSFFPAPAAVRLTLAALLGATGLAGGCLVPSARATTYTWGGTGTAWNVNADWLGNVAPPDDGTADLVFAGNGSKNSSITSAYSIDSLTFNAGAQAYNFTGSALTIDGGGLTEDAVNNENFSVNIVLGAAQTWTLASGAGAVKVASGVNTNGYGLTINAATTTGSGDTISGAITGSGSLTMNGAGILTLDGAGSTYSGDTNINSGVVAFAAAGSVGTGRPRSGRRGVARHRQRFRGQHGRRAGGRRRAHDFRRGGRDADVHRSTRGRE